MCRQTATLEQQGQSLGARKRQVATLEQQKLTATGLGGSLGQCEGHGRDKASSTPPVVPGAAPALEKAGVGGFFHILEIIFPTDEHIFFRGVFQPLARYHMFHQGLEGRSLLRPGRWVAQATAADGGGAWNGQDAWLGRFLGAGAVLRCVMTAVFWGNDYWIQIEYQVSWNCGDESIIELLLIIIVNIDYKLQDPFCFVDIDIPIVSCWDEGKGTVRTEVQSCKVNMYLPWGCNSIVDSYLSCQSGQFSWVWSGFKNCLPHLPHATGGVGQVRGFLDITRW